MTLLRTKNQNLNFCLLRIVLLKSKLFCLSQTLKTKTFYINNSFVFFTFKQAIAIKNNNEIMFKNRIYHTSCHNCDILKFWCECLYLLLTEHFWTKTSEDKICVSRICWECNLEGSKTSFCLFTKTFSMKSLR